MRVGRIERSWLQYLAFQLNRRYHFGYSLKGAINLNVFKCFINFLYLLSIILFHMNQYQIMKIVLL